MNFSQFLKSCDNKNFWTNKKVICFESKDYPLLFFNNLFNFLENKSLLPAQRKNLFLNSTEKIKLFASLQQSFLGQKSFYWLGEYKAGKTELLEYLINYKGPHFIVFCITSEKSNAKLTTLLKKAGSVNIEDKINYETFEQIIKLNQKNLVTKKLTLIKKIFNQAGTLLLENACMLLQYIELTNSKESNQNFEYISSLALETQPSLTFLAQHFFTKQPEKFFNIWSQVCDDYSDMFWISFWSEQIWRAYYVTKFMKQKNFSAARSLSFRLPYTFIQKDWQNICLNTLEKCHQFLYNNDYKLKRGSTFYNLDLFYFNYFTNKFC